MGRYLFCKLRKVSSNLRRYFWEKILRDDCTLNSDFFKISFGHSLLFSQRSFWEFVKKQHLIVHQKSMNLFFPSFFFQRGTLFFMIGENWWWRSSSLEISWSRLSVLNSSKVVLKKKNVKNRASHDTNQGCVW